MITLWGGSKLNPKTSRQFFDEFISSTTNFSQFSTITLLWWTDFIASFVSKTKIRPPSSLPSDTLPDFGTALIQYFIRLIFLFIRCIIYESLKKCQWTFYNIKKCDREITIAPILRFQVENLNKRDYWRYFARSSAP